ncbi:3320_t:CDS:2 [Paraglomus occultum]|uniref:3320_t:CDS:1 n=1 Tax=Paraglomus occultum TaxID=144539 RepID=A0A9N8WJW2_9GLOM|nr:3320_t:CDS:2 [Paraglomus occultum]
MDLGDIHGGTLLKSGIKLGLNVYMDYKAKKTCERVLTVQFRKLMAQGYLSVIGDNGFQLTDNALAEKIGLTAYPDVQAFLRIMNFNVEEVAAVAETRVQIWLNKKYQPWDKRIGNAWPKGANIAKFMRKRASDALNLWYAPNSFGARQSFGQSMSYLVNAEALEGDDPNAKNNAMVIVTRIIGLAQMCGISEIGLVDIIEGLSMSCLFETIARALVAGLRGRHPSEVFNIGLGVRGSSENVHKNFAMVANGFKGPREVIGKYTGGRVVLNLIVAEVVVRDRLNEGEEIWCMSGWAETLRRRTAKLKENVATDIHGNQLRRMKWFKVTLSIKRVNGVPLAKIKQIGTLPVRDRLWGSITGTACPCTSPDPRKKLKNGSRVGKVKLNFKSLDSNNFVKPKPIPKQSVRVYETYGDAVVHLFLSHYLLSATSERQSIASADRKGKGQMGRRPDIMFVLKYLEVFFELLYVECSRLYCTQQKKVDNEVKLWRETNDGMYYVCKVLKPDKDQFGVVGVQVAENMLHLNILVRNRANVHQYYHLQSAEIPVQLSDAKVVANL